MKKSTSNFCTAIVQLELYNSVTRITGTRGKSAVLPQLGSRKIKGRKMVLSNAVITYQANVTWPLIRNQCGTDPDAQAVMFRVLQQHINLANNMLQLQLISFLMRHETVFWIPTTKEILPYHIVFCLQKNPKPNSISVREMIEETSDS